MNIPDSATHKYARVFYKLVGDIWYAWTDGGWHVSRLGAEVLDSGARKLSAPVPPQADVQPVTPIGYVHQWELDRIAAGDAHWATLWSTEGTNNPSRTGPVQALYTHADAGEVEKWKERCQYNADTAHALAEELDALRGEVERWKARHESVKLQRNEYMAGRDTLRAQLAEQDALLEHAVGAIDGEDWEWLLTRIRAALSASAEPGADHDN